jgi:hypothetical protein
VHEIELRNEVYGITCVRNEAKHQSAQGIESKPVQPPYRCTRWISDDHPILSKTLIPPIEKYASGLEILQKPSKLNGFFRAAEILRTPSKLNTFFRLNRSK